jgi:hypothetical protein
MCVELYGNLSNISNRHESICDSRKSLYLKGWRICCTQQCLICCGAAYQGTLLISPGNANDTVWFNLCWASFSCIVRTLVCTTTAAVNRGRTKKKTSFSLGLFWIQLVLKFIWQRAKERWRWGKNGSSNRATWNLNSGYAQQLYNDLIGMKYRNVG